MAPKGNGKSSVVDFVEARNQKLDEKRRKTERIFFRQLLGIYSVSGNSKMRSIEIVDLSEDGLSFQVPYDADDAPSDQMQEFPIRIYFSQDTYLPINVRIRNSRPAIEEGVRVVRYGCEIDKTLSSYDAYLQFVRFIKLYAEHAHKDAGKVSHFYL